MVINMNEIPVSQPTPLQALPCFGPVHASFLLWEQSHYITIGNPMEQTPYSNFLLPATAYRLRPLYSRIFPLIATPTPSELYVLDSQQQFHALHQFFGFRKTEWAQIFNVSRITIYGWLNKSLVPTGEHASKMASLYSLIAAIPERTEHDSLGVYTRMHISILNTSLLQLLCNRSEFETDRTTLVRIITEVLERARNKASALDRLENKQRPSRETFDYNLNQLNP
ncbi:hypothetical protein SpiBuddy_2507 [Sphaerochaeta globosa str. Buddy]|uniref:Uncharacterized protein n=2 Tax=Sphaerochaeta TaxID=399320 RepID=F0RRR0_SPHGB|nr:hypothetical protein SpiBuddy_2507 [Sphaerochaeta globosa str. Buddy]